jgi:hypothetical protein
MGYKAVRTTAIIITCSVLIIAAALWMTRADRYNRQSKTFHSRAGRFSIAFPAKPKKDTQQLNTLQGKWQVVDYHTDCDNVTYSAGYVDLPSEVADTFDPSKKLTDLDPNFQPSLGYSSIEQTVLNFHGHPAVQLKMQEPDGRIKYQREVQVGNRHYCLWAATYQGNIDANRITAFLDSFTVHGLQQLSLP